MSIRIQIVGAMNTSFASELTSSRPVSVLARERVGEDPLSVSVSVPNHVKSYVVHVIHLEINPLAVAQIVHFAASFSQSSVARCDFGNSRRKSKGSEASE